MNKSFYGSLAVNNIKKNAKGYVPYMLTCMVSIMIFYIMTAIVSNPDVSKLLGGDYLRSLLAFGCGVVGFFSAIFLFYTNSFLIKQRKKEIALYNILGMEKRHVGRVLFLETIMTSLASLITGILFGFVFGKLVFLAVAKVMKIDIPLSYVFSSQAAITTIIVFGAIFFVVLICNLGRIRLANPMELLAEGRQGEKEPKTKWLLVLVGLITMGVGYYMAITITSPLQAIAVFFISVLLVITGTYLLFTAGSIALLKMLRKNKDFYYKTEHFTSVSGMLYRMKKNAAGLASICILSTMVLVTVATTVCLQMGAEDIINTSMPNDIQIRSREALSNKEQAKLYQQAKDALNKYDVKTKGITQYDYLASYGIQQEGSLNPSAQVGIDEKSVQMYFIPLKGSSMESDYGSLAKDEVIVGGEEITTSELKIGNTAFKVKDGKSNFITAPEMGAMADAYYILVADDQVMRQLAETISSTFSSEGYYIGIDVTEGSKAHGVKAAEALSKNTPNSIVVDEKSSWAQESYAIYGGLLFVGIFLGLLFLMATVLIIYYKQISEGYEDSERYQIMQKVGMSLAEVKKSIRSQILTVFFLPLIVAVVHVAASFNMMSKLLATLQLTNIWLFVVCTAVTVLIFAVIYVVVYSATAREYYKLVK